VTDPFDVLARHLRSLPEVAARPSDDELIELIVTGAIAPPVGRRLRSPRRRRLRLLGIIAIGGLATGGGVAAALLARSGHTTRPSAGVACRERFDLHSSATVIEPTDDPVAACRDLWQRGQLPTGTAPGTPTGVPTLIACLAPNGALNVLPADPGRTCADLDLATSDTAPITGDVLVTLRNRLSAEIDAVCVPPADAQAAAQHIVDELHITGWTFTVQDMTGQCTRTGTDDVLHTIYLLSGPPPGP
jgi:hypothetical protein